MVWEKRNDIATWFALFITVIGLIPTVGSLLKGVLKAIWHGAKLGEILKIFNYFKKSNGVKWLKELRAGKLKDYAQQAAENAHKLFDALSEKLTQLKVHVPKAMSDTHKALDDTLTRLGEIKGQINSKFAEIAESLKEKLSKSLDDAGDELSLSNTHTKNTRKQELEEPVSERYNNGGVKNVEPKIISGTGSHIELDGHKIYDSGFPPISTNPKAQYRFSDPDYRKTGGDVYFGENVGTSYFEVRKDIKGKSLFVGDVKVDNMLDLTDPNILKQMNIDPKKIVARVDTAKQRDEIYHYTNKISNQAYDEGYNGIIYSSSRMATGNNKAVTLFGDRYDPKAISTIMDRPIKGK